MGLNSGNGTRIVGSATSMLRAGSVSVAMAGAGVAARIIDVDARKAMQARWSYQAMRLGAAIEQGNTVAEAKAMATLVLIEREAMENGLIDVLDCGDCDPASGPTRRLAMSDQMRKASLEHHAQVQGGYRSFTPLVVVPEGQLSDQWVDVTEYPRLNITGHTIEFPMSIAGSRKDRVDLDLDLDLDESYELKEGSIMALGKTTMKQQPLTDNSSRGPVLPVVPVSQAGKGAGQGESLAKAGGLAVSKAEQLKAMKKAQGASVALTGAAVKGQAKAGVSATAKKTKFITKCLDGCGADCGGRFAIGHDAKLKSLLIKIENGVEDISSLPEIVRAFVTYGKPMVTTESVNGKDVQVTHYPLMRAPVRLPGRDDVEYVQDLGEAFGNK